MNHKLDTDEEVFFYEQEFYVLSNFSAFRVQWGEHDFDTSEALYHWLKFDTFEVPYEDVQKQIRLARSAHHAFQIARAKDRFKRPDWDEVKVWSMIQVLVAKVTQHEYVYRKLMETGERRLVEDSWRDDFWGVGPDKNGQNVLGRCWEIVRKWLRKTTESFNDLTVNYPLHDFKLSVLSQILLHETLPGYLFEREYKNIWTTPQYNE